MPGGTATTEVTSLSTKRIEAQPDKRVMAIAAKTIEKNRVIGQVAVRMRCSLEVHMEMTWMPGKVGSLNSSSSKALSPASSAMPVIFRSLKPCS